MTNEEYEAVVVHTDDYDSNDLSGLIFATLGLTGESGEVAEKVKKLFRDHNGLLTSELRLALLKELGDVQWYLAKAASELGSSLSEVMSLSKDKLLSRKSRGVLNGDGDDR